jgi:tetratricopeptide (TPR) repeat protein
LAEGEFAQVRYHIDRGLDKMATERGSMAADLDLHAMAVDTAARSQDQEGLQKYLTVSEEAAERANHGLYKAVARRARGINHRLAGELGQAADQLAGAVDEFRALDTPWQIGRTLLELGEIEQLRGDTDSAREHYSEAKNTFGGIGAVPYEERARSALESIG